MCLPWLLPQKIFSSLQCLTFKQKLISSGACNWCTCITYVIILLVANKNLIQSLISWHCNLLSNRAYSPVHLSLKVWIFWFKMWKGQEDEHAVYTDCRYKLDRNNSVFSHGEQQCASTLTEPEKEQWGLVYIPNYLFSFQGRLLFDFMVWISPESPLKH